MTKNIVIALLIALSVSLGLFALWPGPSMAKGCTMVRASFYGLETCRKGKPCLTANGEKFNPNALTAAHKTLPFNTKLRVTYKGKSVVVRLNDRGPYSKGRSLDLSRAAAVRLGMVDAGVVKLCMERL
jgi:rare lipoprotein A